MKKILKKLLKKDDAPAPRAEMWHGTCASGNKVYIWQRRPNCFSVFLQGPDPPASHDMLERMDFTRDEITVLRELLRIVPLS